MSSGQETERISILTTLEPAWGNYTQTTNSIVYIETDNAWLLVRKQKLSY